MRELADTVTRRLRIHGRVQGVWYRAWTVRAAEELGLVGWVRNCRDGSVEAVIQGETACVQQLIDRARSGPRDAEVSHIEIANVAPVALQAFELWPTE